MQQNLYNVKFKIGKRSYTSKIYSSSHENILAFATEYLEAKVVSISQIVYDVESSAVIPSDDSNNYKKTLYFMVSNNDDGKASQIVIQTAKNTKSYQDIFEGIRQYLKIDDVSNITGLINVNESQK